MQFSDTTYRTGLIQDCEYWCRLGDTGISGSDRLMEQFTRSINHWYHQVVVMILQSQDEWDFDDVNHPDYPILTTSLVADQRDYTLPASEKVLKIKRVDICYDGTGNVCYKAEPFDSEEYGRGIGNDTNMDQDFAKSAPKYDVRSNSIFIYPRASAENVTNSGVIRIEWTREIDEFVYEHDDSKDTSQEPGIDEPWHRMLSLGASYDWLVNKDSARAGEIKKLLDEYEQRLKQYYGSKVVDRRYIIKPAHVDYE